MKTKNGDILQQLLPISFLWASLALAPGACYSIEYLNIYVSGLPQPMVTNPNGENFGIDPATGGTVEDLTDVEMNFSSTSSYLSVPSPISGTYLVTINGSNEEQVSFEIEYVNTALPNYSEVRLFNLFHGAPLSFTLNIDPSSPTPLVVTPPTEVISNISVEDNSGMTRLIWDVSGDPNISHYNIYTKRPEDAFFSLLGTTTSLFYDTPHPLRTDTTGEVWRYVVTGETSDGKESFYNYVEENVSLTRAFISADQTVGLPPLVVQFSDESSGAPTSWEWDFNNDGIVDSTVQNPQFTYNAIGRYSVRLAITGPSGQDENHFLALHLIEWVTFI